MPSSKECSSYGKRATASRRAQLYCVEGETLTMEQIGARLGLAASVAYDRLRRARRRPGPVTWERLK